MRTISALWSGVLALAVALAFGAEAGAGTVFKRCNSINSAHDTGINLTFRNEGVNPDVGRRSISISRIVGSGDVLAANDYSHFHDVITLTQLPNEPHVFEYYAIEGQQGSPQITRGMKVLYDEQSGNVTWRYCDVDSNEIKRQHLDPLQICDKPDNHGRLGQDGAPIIVSSSTRTTAANQMHCDPVAARRSRPTASLLAPKPSLTQGKKTNAE
jgi:hypothetical protein